MQLIVTLRRDGIKLTNVVIEIVKPGDLPTAFKRFIERAQIAYGDAISDCEISIRPDRAGGAVAPTKHQIRGQ